MLMLQNWPKTKEIGLVQLTVPTKRVLVVWKIMYGHPSGSEHITLRALRGEL